MCILPNVVLVLFLILYECIVPFAHAHFVAIVADFIDVVNFVGFEWFVGTTIHKYFSKYLRENIPLLL